MVSGQSSATGVAARSPLRILVPRPRGQAVWAYLSSYGGGLLPGDCLNVSVEVGKNARCFLGTQSATRIFREGPKGVAESHLQAKVGSGGLLIYAPDVAQGFANSRFHQAQRFELEDASARLLFLDWYCSGRLARGERWQFAEYISRSEVAVGGKTIFLDSTALSRGAAVGIPERMGRINCVATLVLVGFEVPDTVSNLPVQKCADTVVVASAFGGGTVLRCAGISVEKVAREIFSRLDFIAPLLGDDPFARKW